MKQAMVNVVLKGLLAQRQELEDSVREGLGVEAKVTITFHSGGAETPAEAVLYRQLFDAALAHPNGDYSEYGSAKWAEVNAPDDKYNRHMTVFTDLPPSNKQLARLAARKERKAAK